jgi:capsid protein
MSLLSRAFLAVLLAVGASIAPLKAAFSADLGVYVDDGSVCGEKWVLNRITERFGYQVRHVPHLPQVGIAEFRNVRLNRHHPERPDRPIERTYCTATVLLSDGHSRQAWYLIEGRMGFAGVGRNVEFCVSGFDRWHVYDGSCRVLR